MSSVYITCVVNLGEFTLQVNSLEEGRDGRNLVRFVELHDSLTNSGDIYTQYYRYGAKGNSKTTYWS